MRCLYTILLLAGTLLGKAQSVYFEKNDGTEEDDWARSVIELSDGTIYTAGYSNTGAIGGTDVFLSKWNKYGNIIWTKYFGDTLDNVCFSMALTSDGKLVLAGETQTTGTQTDGFLMKLDTSGNEIWTQFYSTPVNESVYSVVLLNDGGFALAGFINDTSGYNNEWILRTDSLGNEIWQKNLGGTDNDYAMGLQQTPQGHILVSADTRSQGAGGYDVELIKLDTAGNIIWSQVYGDSLQNGCQGLFITSDNKYIVCGESENAPFSPFDFFSIKCDTAGNVPSLKKTGGIYADAAFSMVENTTGHYVFTGYSASYSVGNNNLVMVETDTAWNIIWVKTFGGPGVDIGYKIIKSVLGGYIMVGTYSDSVNGSINQYVIHTDENGEFVSIDQTQENRINLFPNPANDYIEITGIQPGAVITVINAMGQNVVRQTHQSAQRISIKSLEPGFYLVNITEGERAYMSRFIKR